MEQLIFARAMPSVKLPAQLVFLAQQLLTIAYA
jgi:hypothetical protein